MVVVGKRQLANLSRALVLRENGNFALCESCKLRPRGAGGQLTRCIECLSSLVERDRRLRAERATLRGDKLIRAKLATAKSGEESPQANGGGLKTIKGNQTTSARGTHES